MSEIMDPSKLKVAELRAELQARNLDSKGNKPVLVERLREALEAEAAEGGVLSAPVVHNVLHNPGGETSHVEDVDDDIVEIDEEELESEPEPEAEGVDEPDSADEVEQVEHRRETKPDPEMADQEVQESEPEQEEEEEEEDDDEQDIKEDPAEMEEEEAQRVKEELQDEDVPMGAVKDEPYESNNKEGFEEAPVEEIKREYDNGESVDIKDEPAEVKVEPTEEGRRGEKRAAEGTKLTPAAKRSRPDVELVRVEDEYDFDKSLVVLDWYNSDMSLIISKEDRLSAYPLTGQGFGYVWHGVRATYGFTKGKVFYEVKVMEHLSVPHLEADEQHPHVIRVGWSVDDTGLMLGEEPLSYGYGGTGKASSNLKFKDYGKKFGKGDVVGCFLDLDVQPAVISFTVNGEHLGIAYEIRHREIGDAALFPHIVTKNSSFQVNFGQEDPWFEPLTGYKALQKVPLEERVLATQGPEKREDCEMIMMVGLPAAGKTTWVDNYCLEHPERKYNVLGTNNLIDKMKVMGLPRKRNYSGRWEVLIERCTKCLNRLLDLSYKRRRNFIIDQTNVYPSAQRRKMKGFAGFKRRAVVICPTDEDLKKRTANREKEEGKDVPDKAVLEMKANYKLPEENDLFDTVEFIELSREESQKLVEQYNKEGIEAGFGPRKPGFRGGFDNRRGYVDRRGGFGKRINPISSLVGSRGGFRGGWDRERRGTSFDRRDRGGSWNRESRDSRDYNRGSTGSYNRESRGSFNRDSRGGFQNRDNRSGRGGWQQSSWNKGQSNTGGQGYGSGSGGGGGGSGSWSQGSSSSQGYGNWGNNQNYSNQGSYGSQGYGSQNYGSQGYGNWNQQYYQQQYWGGQNYGYGQQQQSGYGQQSYKQAPQATTGGSSNSSQYGQWGNQQGWGGYGSNYNQSGYGSYGQKK